MMRWRWGIALLLIGLAACRQPVTEDEVAYQPIPTIPGLDITAATPITPAISLSYDPALAQGLSCRVETQGAVVTTPAGVVALEYPQHLICLFDNYQPGTLYHLPAIRIYPAAAYRTVNPDAGRVIEHYQKMQEDRPDNPDPVAFLPLFYAAPTFTAQVAYLDFSGGSGVRYLTQLSQGTAPANNREMFYTFQGMTGDGRYYVSLILPVNHPSLPDTDQGEPAAATLEETALVLDSQPEESFIPSLALLDEMVRSLQIPAELDGLLAASSVPAPPVDNPPGCTHSSIFLVHVTIPNNTVFVPNEAFTKVWQVRNTGTCTWGGGYQIVHVGENSLRAEAAIDIPFTAPGQTVNIEMKMYAPSTPGDYYTSWRLQSPDGEQFGQYFYLKIIVQEE